MLRMATSRRMMKKMIMVWFHSAQQRTCSFSQLCLRSECVRAVKGGIEVDKQETKRRQSNRRTAIIRCKSSHHTAQLPGGRGWALKSCAVHKTIEIMVWFHSAQQRTCSFSQLCLRSECVRAVKGGIEVDKQETKRRQSNRRTAIIRCKSSHHTAQLPLMQMCQIRACSNRATSHGFVTLNLAPVKRMSPQKNFK